ncbi:hypothetical protein ACOME3_009562 [Neoechinorhynchus agilis]
MPEYIQIQVGGYGANIGAYCWGLYCLEHGLNYEGRSLSGPPSASIHSFFNEIEPCVYKPRSIFVDTNANDTMRIQSKGHLRKMFEGQFVQTLSDLECTSYGDFVYDSKRDVYADSSDVIRAEVERTDQLAGFIIINSAKAMSGSVLSQQILTGLADKYHRKTKISFTDFPAIGKEALAVYNAVLYQANTAELTDCTFCLDFDSIGAWYKDRYSKENATFQDGCKLISQAISGVTMFDRLSKSRTGGLCQMISNLQMTRKLHFPIMFFSTEIDRKISTWELTRKVFRPASCLLTIDTREGSFMGCNFNYRGIASRRSIHDDLKRIRAIEPYKSYVEDAVINLDYLADKPVRHGKGGLDCMDCSLLLACHTTGVRQLWERIAIRTSVLHSKAMLLHHFDVDYSILISEAANMIVDLASEYQRMEPIQTSKVSRTEGKKVPV